MLNEFEPPNTNFNPLPLYIYCIIFQGSSKTNEMQPYFMKCAVANDQIIK